MSTVGLLDTCVVIETSDPEFGRGILPDESFISAVTLGELSAGPLLASDPREAGRRLRFLQAVEIAFNRSTLAYDAPAARVMGTVVADVARAGRSPRSRVSDLLIAAIAISNELPLYTINVDDFEGISDLELVRVPPAS